MPAVPKAATQDYISFDMGDGLPPSPQPLHSDSQDDSVEDYLTSVTTESPDLNASNGGESPAVEVYDQYNLDGFTKEEFEMLWNLAPADQRLDIKAPEDNADLPPDRSAQLSGTHSAVSLYVRSHKFFQTLDAPHTVSQRRTFERNVYDFAEANGFRKREATEEVRRARLSCGARDYDSEDTSFGVEIDDRSKILADLAKTTVHGQYRFDGRTGEGQQMRSRGKRRQRRSRTGMPVGEVENVARSAPPLVAGPTHGKNAETRNATAGLHKTAVGEKPRSTSVPVTESRRTRAKRKQNDADAGNDAIDGSKEPKEAKYSQSVDNQQSAVRQRQFPPNDQTVTEQQTTVNMKALNQSHDALLAERKPHKALKREEKRKRKREKQKAEAENVPVPRNGNSEVPQAQSTEEQPESTVEMLAPNTSASAGAAATKKSKRRKLRSSEDGNQVAVASSSSSRDKMSPPKEYGPNDPKSEQEAHQNFLKSNNLDPHEHSLTADNTPNELEKAEKHQSKFIEKLNALKRFSNEKQLQQYEDGGYANADKQTKDDLKDLKEEQTTMKEMNVDDPHSKDESDKKAAKKSRKTKGKGEKPSREKERSGKGNREAEGTKDADESTRKRKRGASKEESPSQTEQAGFH